MKNKKTLTIVLAIFFLILLTPIVEANFQIISGGSRIGAVFFNFPNNVREMEKSGQVMGLSETYDSSTLKATSTSTT